MQLSVAIRESCAGDEAEAARTGPMLRRFHDGRKQPFAGEWVRQSVVRIFGPVGIAATAVGVVRRNDREPRESARRPQHRPVQDRLPESVHRRVEATVPLHRRAHGRCPLPSARRKHRPCAWSCVARATPRTTTSRGIDALWKSLTNAQRHALRSKLRAQATSR